MHGVWRPKRAQRPRSASPAPPLRVLQSRRPVRSPHRRAAASLARPADPGSLASTFSLSAIAFPPAGRSSNSSSPISSSLSLFSLSPPSVLSSPPETSPVLGSSSSLLLRLLRQWSYLVLGTYLHSSQSLSFSRLIPGLSGLGARKDGSRGENLLVFAGTRDALVPLGLASPSP